MVSRADCLAGKFEGTIHQAFVAAGNFRRCLMRPRPSENAQPLRDCQALFKRLYVRQSDRLEDDEERFAMEEGSTLPDETLLPAELVPFFPNRRKAVQLPRLRKHGTVYSRCTTHEGNSLIMFHRNGGNGEAVPGSIEHIVRVDGQVLFAVRRYGPVDSTSSDPFARWPDFPAKLWSSSQEDLELVKPQWVSCQFAKYAVSDSSIVVLMLPKVKIIAYLFTHCSNLLSSRTE